VEVTPGWAHTLNTYMSLNPQVAICQPKILSYNNRRQFDYAGAAGGYLDLLAYPFCRGRVFNHIERDQEQYGDSQDIFWAGGACFCIRASIFHELGGFDEEFFAHMEEIDLCWRSQRLGYKTACVTDCVVYHVGGGTLKSGNPLKTYLNFRNGLQLLVKNSSISALIWKLPMRIFLDLVAALRFLLLGNWPHVRSVLKAIVVFVATFPRTWRKRNEFKAPFHSRLDNIILVWEYFILRRQTYQELPNTD
jgi:GT2 family glycosyltransferase